MGKRLGRASNNYLMCVYCIPWLPWCCPCLVGPHTCTGVLNWIVFYSRACLDGLLNRAFVSSDPPESPSERCLDLALCCTSCVYKKANGCQESGLATGDNEFNMSIINCFRSSYCSAHCRSDLCILLLSPPLFPPSIDFHCYYFDCGTPFSVWKALHNLSWARSNLNFSWCLMLKRSVIWK